MDRLKIYDELRKHIDINYGTINKWAYINKDITGVLVSENVTHAVIDEAKENNCNLIIAHHPVIYIPLGETISADFVPDVYDSEIIQHAEKEKITIYTIHEALDAAQGGLNDYFAECIGVEVEDGFPTYARYGHFKTKGTLKDKAIEIGKILNDTHVRTIGDINRELSTVCVSTGAGARDEELINILKSKGIDVLISGENKLSVALKMKYYDICLIEVGHYNSEIICKDIFEKWLSPLSIKIIKSEKDTNPYNI